MTDVAKVKEVATQLANVAIVNYNDKSLSGEEREHNVCEFLAGLVRTLPGASWLPQELVADALDIGLDELQEFYKDNLQSFVKKCFGRIKHILHIG